MKRFFWGISVNPNLPAQMNRFPTNKELVTWISQDQEWRGRVSLNHPAFWVVRRINRMIQKGESVSFPVDLNNGPGTSQ